MEMSAKLIFFKLFDVMGAQQQMGDEGSYLPKW